MLNITEKSEGEAAKDYVLRQLIYNIVHTNLLPGQKLEAPELCSLMNVSNNPLREAELEKKEYLDAIPMHKLGKAEDVANVVSSLCSDAFSYVTGQVIVLDGGLSL